MVLGTIVIPTLFHPIPTVIPSLWIKPYMSVYQNLLSVGWLNLLIIVCVCMYIHSDPIV